MTGSTVACDGVRKIMRRAMAQGGRVCVVMKAVISEGHPALARALGQSLDAAVVLVAAAVEDAGLHAGGLGPVGQQFASLARLLGSGELAQVGLDPVDGRDRVTTRVVDELGEDAAVGAVDGEARPLRGAADPGADPAAAAHAALAVGEDAHARLPTLR